MRKLGDAIRVCEVEGCLNVLKKTHGHICPKHRTRMFRHGNYNTISPNWPNLKKGTPSVTKLGYVRVNVDGKRVLQHRYIMEQHLGRKLTQDERIHHINGNKTDNRIENLELQENNGEHMRKYHRYGWKTRKINPVPTAETIHSIVNRISLPTKTHETCFCGSSIMGRNLCSKHYQWAYSHKLF